MARQNPVIPDPTVNPVLASFDDYLDAQAAVDKLSDNKFPVQAVTIVGVDLKMVEQVLGRMSTGRAAAGGLLMGAWFGLLLGFFVSFFAVEDGVSPTSLVLLGILYGAGFGIIFGLVSHLMTGGKRDFVSRNQIRATRYDVHVDPKVLADAKKILGISNQWPPPLPVTPVVDAAAPSEAAVGEAATVDPSKQP